MGVKISNLPAIVAPALSDVFPVVQAGVTYKETVTQLATLLTASGGIVSFTSPSIANHFAVFTNTAGNISQDVATAINGGNIQAGLSGTAGYLSTFPGTATKGSLRIVAAANAGDTVTQITNASFGQATVLTIPDPGAATANFVLSTSLASQSAGLTSSSATPSANSFVGFITLTNSVVTSGQGGGLAGTVTMVGASGGTIFGTEGQVVPSGTLSGTVNCAALYGNLSFGSATINSAGCNISAIRGIWENAAGTATNLTGCHGISFTNGTVNVLNSQLYLLGGATYGLELDSNTGTAGTTYIATPGGSTPSGNIRTIKVRIDGADYYLLAAATYS